MSFLTKYQNVVELIEPVKTIGYVDMVNGMFVESVGPNVVIGELCRITNNHDGGYVFAEVVGIRHDRVQLMLYSDVENIAIGSPVTATGSPLKVPVGSQLLGKVLDARGRSKNNHLLADHEYSILREAPDVLSRPLIDTQLVTGIRAIDAFLSIGKGQRIGIFSGSGVGKSTLLGMLARNTSVDVNVIALIGERGREVREFIEQNLGEEGMQRSVVVVSTANEPAIARFRAAFVAVSIAEYFRDQGNDVLLLFDSITRFARAQREISLAKGEMPAFRGFPPSVDAVLPKLLERCGTASRGSITAFINVLVEGDDLDEPISDTIRGILDGHIVLSRALAEQNHFPAIDVLRSVSRLATQVAPSQLSRYAVQLRQALARYEHAKDIIQSGIYIKGSDEKLDAACHTVEQLSPFLTQQLGEYQDMSAMLQWLAELVGEGVEKAQ